MSRRTVPCTQHAPSRFLPHLVDTNHRNFSTLRRFLHDVLLIECHGSLFLCGLSLRLSLADFR